MTDKPSPETVELTLLVAAVRCAWGGALADDAKLLAQAVAQSQALVGTPAYALALSASAWLHDEALDLGVKLDQAVIEYCQLRLPPQEPDPPGRPWEREHGLIG